MPREAAAFLALLSGRRHRVVTAVAVRRGERRWSRAVETAVRFKRLGGREIDAYLASGEWQGKAGGYAIQGRAGGFVPWIGGSYSNVVGLPLTETLGLLAAAGRRPGMKGRQILIEPLPAGGHAAALMVDGRLEDLLVDPDPSDPTPRPGGDLPRGAGPPDEGSRRRDRRSRRRAHRLPARPAPAAPRDGRSWCRSPAGPSPARRHR